MNPDVLSELIAVVARDVIAVREPEVAASIDSSAIAFERPKNRDHGDWATSVALKLAKRVGMAPRDLAAELAGRISEIEGVSSVDIAGPGFLNIRLDASAAGEIARSIVEAGSEFGRNDSLVGQTINLEFVSANPTGPLHIGHTRWAALGDSLGRVLAASGARVANEFYVNDAGAQMDVFGESVLAAALGEPTPENGYPGEYVQELGRIALERRPDLASLDRAEAILVAREIGYETQLQEIKDSLSRFNVHFDVWFSERTLHAGSSEGGSLIDDAIERLRAQGHVFDEDGAVWVRTTDFGDDKDRVITRGNGIFTYFAADAAYYLSKGDRGFQHKIYLLGADHHGYVHRLKALAGSAGDDPEKDIEVLIGQLVSINGAKLSKRAGNIIELNDLQAWLGTDALRYSLARYPADSPLTLDPELLQKRTNDNPVFYVQYAHARICSVLRAWADKDGGDVASLKDVDLSALDSPQAQALMLQLAKYPAMLSAASADFAPHDVTFYLRDLAASYHSYYDAERILVDDEAVKKARLALVAATAQVLHNGLAVLGVSAPASM